MIVSETIVLNGKEFIKTYSDSNLYIERDGLKYSEAIDPIGFNRVYSETNEPIEVNSEEATSEDYLEALNRLGVSDNEEKSIT